MAHFPEHLKDRFQRFKFRHFETHRETYEELAKFGQNPDVMIVSCCDSRCDPETIFSARQGELFVVRNIANLIPPYETGGKYHGVSAALEFAVLNIRVKHILIMGHTGCGGIKAALEGGVAKQTEAMFISRWMSIIEDSRISVLAAHQGTSLECAAQELERASVKTSLANLRSFPFVKDIEDRGRLSLHGAVFDIANGSLLV
ncbi:MAG: carbonic anhydrase, partial [Gammaproteobacteria bacterium]